jgi:hypothetical protein
MTTIVIGVANVGGAAARSKTEHIAMRVRMQMNLPVFLFKHLILHAICSYRLAHKNISCESNLTPISLM